MTASENDPVNTLPRAANAACFNTAVLCSSE